MARFVDWALEERKLQGVYEDIQMGRVEAAHDAAERWLTRNPRSQPALVIRMVLCEKRKRGTRAVLAAYDDVRATGPLSGRSVWWIALTLRNIRRPDLVLALYQGIWDARPTIAELGREVFFSAAAMGDTETMAATSRKLFNATKSPAWARLAAFSAWAHHAPAPSDAQPFPLAPARTLLPAALLLRTAGDEVATPDTLWLGLQIALGSGDVADAWRLVRDEGRKGALARRWVGMEAAKVVGERGGVDDVWDDEIDATVRLLRHDAESQHNYAYYRHILACFAKLPSAEVAAEVAGLFGDLEARIGGKERAPLLALLELDDTLRRLQVAGAAPLEQPAWEDAVRRYLARWGSKGSTITELVGVAGERLPRVVEIVKEVTAKPYATEKEYLARSVAEQFLLRQHGEEWAPTLADAEAYWALYLDGLQYGKNLPKTELQPADPMGLAAVQVLLKQWQGAPADDAPLLSAAALLEYIVSRSPSSFAARFTLVRVYRLLRAPAMYIAQLDKLGLSEIQLDNLAHVMIERGGALEARIGGAAKQWHEMSTKAALMYQRSATDLPEYIKQALDNESYSKVPGIRTLINCLESSFTARALDVEELGLALVTGTEIPEDNLDLLTAALAKEAPFIDNRNYELLVDSLVDGPAPQPRVTEAWVRAYGTLGLRVARYVRGEVEPSLPTPNLEALSDVDQAYYAAIDAVLRRATATGEGEETSSLAGVFDANIKLVHQQTTPWARWNALLTLGQLVRTIDAIAKRVGEAAKGKGKKKPTPLTALANDLKTARDGLKGKVDDVVRLVELDAKPDWTQVGKGFIEDQAFVAALGRKITAARSEQLASGVRKLFSGKQL
ncbi:N-alpha-acetyltransferase 25, NatB auxiliary subunit [Vanrija pseudolonga]|uniref:N-alpha-acetyltransferase 25, NatB auxiliary subunit n=1 Tax=Vanrija pseudolonga TaxID=143232 RepID=A0AAF0YAK0_9TREE|nr:N-alpha-acetyltransferase 25, NatB auxiliary subunit [Vanrija pseudolonga]